jgi:hypothetical protein
VLAVGDDVDEFEVADNVVSTFWPYWLGGTGTVSKLMRTFHTPRRRVKPEKNFQDTAGSKEKSCANLDAQQIARERAQSKNQRSQVPHGLPLKWEVG